jgi:ketosteroid isomerase-like protein
MPAAAKAEAALLAALGAYSDAYGKGDAAGLAACYLPGRNAVAIGPGFKDRWEGRAHIKAAFTREFRNFPGSSLEFTWASISGGTKGVAWVGAECRAHVRIDNKILLIDARFTAVFELKNRRWLIAQSHLSFPTAY